jgi:hypothetical protein
MLSSSRREREEQKKRVVVVFFIVDSEVFGSALGARVESAKGGFVWTDCVVRGDADCAGEVQEYEEHE